MSWPSRGVGQRSRVARRGLVLRARCSTKFDRTISTVQSDRFALSQAQKLVGDILWRGGDRAGARSAWQAGLAAWPNGMTGNAPPDGGARRDAARSWPACRRITDRIATGGDGLPTVTQQSCASVNQQELGVRHGQQKTKISPSRSEITKQPGTCGLPSRFMPTTEREKITFKNEITQASSSISGSRTSQFRSWPSSGRIRRTPCGYNLALGDPPAYLQWTGVRPAQCRK